MTSPAAWWWLELAGMMSGGSELKHQLFLLLVQHG